MERSGKLRYQNPINPNETAVQRLVRFRQFVIKEVPEILKSDRIWLCEERDSLLRAIHKQKNRSMASLLFSVAVPTYREGNTTTNSILNGEAALTACGIPAGITILCPAVSAYSLLSIVMTPLPSSMVTSASPLDS